jgi:hypothetical protein
MDQKTTTEQLQAAMVRRRTEAAAEYFELLSRNDNPKPGDADKLAECMKTLGRTSVHIADDLAIVNGILAGRKAQARNAELDGPIREAVVSRRAVQDQCERERAEQYEKHKLLLEAEEHKFGRLSSERTALQEPINKKSYFDNRWDAIVTGTDRAS